MALGQKGVDMIRILQDQGKSPEKKMRYGVYSIQGAIDSGQSFTRSFIVLRNGYGMITRFTRLEQFMPFYQYKAYKPIDSDPGSKLYYVTQMLNYVLVDNGEEFGIRHVFGITKDMLERFFYDYALEAVENGRYRGQATIEMCITTVVGFMANLSWKYGSFMKVKHSDLYKEKIIYDKRGKQKKISIPAFQVNGVKEVKYIFRDIPTKAFEIMIPLAFRFAPGIAFAMCIQAFAGLRPGEACNVRREDSPYGPGITITEIGGRASKIEIDLKRELRLRSDDVKVGDIKKERTQFVYPVFIVY